MFLSTYENKLDKKGRVSVPASFRSHLSNLGYNGVICYPSFNNASIEACSQDRIEKISSAIDSLNPFEEKRDFFAPSILAESINLQFDSEGRISLSSKLLKHAKIKTPVNSGVFYCICKGQAERYSFDDSLLSFSFFDSSSFE